MTQRNTRTRIVLSGLILGGLVLLATTMVRVGPAHASGGLFGDGSIFTTGYIQPTSVLATSCYATPVVTSFAPSCYATSVTSTSFLSTPVITSFSTPVITETRTVVPTSVRTVVPTSFQTVVPTSFRIGSSTERVLSRINGRLYYVRPTSFLAPVTETVIYEDIVTPTAVTTIEAGTSCYSSSVIRDEPVVVRDAPRVQDRVIESSPNLRYDDAGLRNGGSSTETSPPPAEPANEVGEGAEDGTERSPIIDPTRDAGDLDGTLQRDGMPLPPLPDDDTIGATTTRRVRRPVSGRSFLPVLTIAVVDRDTQEPIRGVAVTAEPLARDSGYRGRRRSTDEFGEAVIPLPPGDWTLSIRMPSGRNRAVAGRPVFTATPEYITDLRGRLVDGVLTIER